MSDFECPHCGEQIDIEAYEISGLITLHGDGPAQEVECMCCEKAFWVKEAVSRDFTAGFTEEEATRW